MTFSPHTHRLTPAPMRRQDRDRFAALTASAAPPPLSLDEAALDGVLTRATTAPRALDRLDCGPLVLSRPDHAPRPLVVVTIAARPLIMSADTARRLAVHQSARGREGAAHDLIGAADQAEEITHLMHRAASPAGIRH